MDTSRLGPDYHFATSAALAFAQWRAESGQPGSAKKKRREALLCAGQQTA
jgi:hypothetical protein